MAEKKSKAELQRKLLEKESSLAEFLAKRRGKDEITYEDYKEAQEILAGKRELDLEKPAAAEKKYTGGKVGDKYYGGGLVYPRPTKGNY